MTKVISQTEIFMVELNFTSNGQSNSHTYLRTIKNGNNPVGLNDFPMLQNIPEVNSIEVVVQGISQVEQEYQFNSGVDLEYIFDMYGNVYRQLS